MTPPRRRVCAPIHTARLLATCLALICCTADARLWTTTTGQTFEAEFVRVEGDKGIFRVRDREDPYPLNRLSAADRLFIGQTLRAQGGSNTSTAAPASPSPATKSAAAAAASPKSAGAMQFAGQPLPADGAGLVDITISDAAQLKEVKNAYGKPSTRAKMLVALPPAFQPTRNYPLLIVSATTDGAGSSVNSARANYLPDATAKGFVVIAVDGEFGKPTDKGHDSPPFRWALVQAALGAIYQEWPQAKKWPIVTAGISGGGGYASFQTLLLLDKQYPLIGLLLAVTGHTPGNYPDLLKQAPQTAIRTLPVFFTAGKNDEVATEEVTDDAHRELKRAGFKNVRFETFDGGHRLHRPHLQEALDWFVAEYRKTAGKSSVL